MSKYIKVHTLVPAIYLVEVEDKALHKEATKKVKLAVPEVMVLTSEDFIEGEEVSEDYKVIL